MTRPTKFDDDGVRPPPKPSLWEWLGKVGERLPPLYVMASLAVIIATGFSMRSWWVEQKEARNKNRIELTHCEDLERQIEMQDAELDAKHKSLRDILAALYADVRDLEKGSRGSTGIVYRGPRTLELEEAPTPKPGRHHRVQIMASQTWKTRGAWIIDGPVHFTQPPTVGETP